MITIKGNYNEAIVYTDEVAENTIEQIQALLDQEFTKGAKIRIMPDCHYGAGCVIGTTMTIKNKVVPNLVGVDIGCGMLTVKLGKINIDYPKLDNYIRENIPYGMNVNKTIIDKSIDISKLCCYKELRKKNYLWMSLGSLGSGNHFIEIDKDENDILYLIIHSGSRNLGKQVAEFYQKSAIQYHKDKVFNAKIEIPKIIKEYKEKGLEKQLQSKLESIHKMNYNLSIPESLCYLEGELFEQYMVDMDICQKFASKNREVMAQKIVTFLNLDYEVLDKFETIHNYINMNDKILRKGSISAYKNEIVLIPMNMRDGCIIGKGKSNSDYNFSAPHGAGRKMSRGEALKNINLDDFKNTMKGIYSTSVLEQTIDESPFAYKDMKSIIDNIQDTVEIIKTIKPVYNFKAC